MAPPPPALTLVLTRMLILLFSLAVRIHDWTTARFDCGFHLHLASPIH